MTIEQNDIFEYVKSLENKIDHLTDMMEKLLSQPRRTRVPNAIPDAVPDHSLQDWLNTIVVNEEHIHIVFETNISEGFKSVLTTHKKLYSCPLNYEKRKLFVYNGESWERFTENHYRSLITSVWQKMIRQFMQMVPDPDLSDDVRDLNTKKIMSMRYVLCDVEKNRKQLTKWLSEIL